MRVAFFSIYSGIFFCVCVGMVRCTVCFGGARGCIGDDTALCDTSGGIVRKVEQVVWLQCVQHLCRRFVQQQRRILQYHRSTCNDL